MKYAIVASRLDKAGMNIVSQLKELNCKFPIHLVDKELITAENIDKDLDADFIVFASKHQSTKKEQTLSVHTIGNFQDAKYGGKPKTLSPASAQITKHFFQKLNKLNTSDYKVTLEATHRGPYIETPSLFIEIGSTEEEWKDKKAGKIIAQTIINSLETKPKNSKIAFGIGGPHYCPNFNDIQLNSNYALSFIVPKYGLPLTESLVKQLKEKTIEQANIAIVDWKGFNNAEEKNKTIELLKEQGIEIVRTKEARLN